MANARVGPSPNENLVLYEEVGGLCPYPACAKPLMKRVGGKLVKLYEVAHIYPLNPTTEEQDLLKNEEQLSKDVNHEDNLIALCRDCHKVFDNPRTVEEYRSIVAIKKELQRQAKMKFEWTNNHLNDEINDLIDRLSEIDIIGDVELSYTAVTIEEKTDITLNAITRTKIHNYVRYFYNEVRLMFSELEKLKPNITEIIFSQVKIYYLKLKSKGLSQTRIFHELVAWLKNKSEKKDGDAAEVLVSFFIQNCEVFS